MSFAISAAWELGLLDELESNDYLDMTDFIDKRDLHADSLAALVDVLAQRDIVDATDIPKLYRGRSFADVFAAKGFFYWLTRGCGELLSTVGDITSNNQRVGRFIHRDLRAVGIACRDLGTNFFDPPFFDLLEDLKFDAVADLGCGSAERLVRIAESRPEIRCVGVDISPTVISLAAEALDESGLAQRIKLVEADARVLSARPDFVDVNLVTCFLMGHDFWPRPQCVESLRSIRNAFPNATNFILCDTYRSQAAAMTSPTIFTPGFEFVHAVMGQYLPTLDEWHGVFAEGGWQVAEQRDIPVPANTAMFVLQPA